jgi:endonuclease/exonuclease/phosphatase family metal-dependent hydrolase
MTSDKGKSKLRTASDVIARLKWSFDEQFTSQNSIIGYDCRIHGPMEKYVADFAGIDEGGDIPEHRIQYFRLKGTKNYEKLIFWDRVARVDRLFGSGNHADLLSPATVTNAVKAVATMKRIAEEKAIRAEEKAKRRARQHARKAVIAQYAETSASKIPNTVEIKTFVEGERHVWEELKMVFVYDATTSDWVARQSLSQHNSSLNTSGEKIKFITWNVLFDLHHNEKHEFVQGDDTLLDVEDKTPLRWQELIDELADEDADVIALQEVTPRFLEQLQSCQWVRNHYSLSTCSKSLRGTDMYGNLFLWKHSSFKSCQGLHLCRDGDRNRAIVLSLSQTSGHVFNVSNVHLPADQYDDVTGESRDRTRSRQRELSAIVSKLQALEQIQRNKKINPIPFLIGDFNTGANEPDVLQAGFWIDAWLHPSDETEDLNGFTFDWTRNARANKTRMHGHSERGPRRIDRVFLGNQQIVMPIQSHLLGDSPQGFPPSDHFGVSVSFAVQALTVNTEPILYNPSKVGHNAWATSGVPTTDSLLALVFECQEVENSTTKLYDPTSTLPLAHVTLLNGFVDLSNIEAQKLAIQAVQDAVHQTLYSQDPSKQWTLPIDRQSLTIFEHRESASLVCVPKKDKGSWLNRLYQTLRAKFSLCDEQESRFTDGWTPHCRYWWSEQQCHDVQNSNHHLLLLSRSEFGKICHYKRC